MPKEKRLFCKERRSFLGWRSVVLAWSFKEEIFHGYFFVLKYTNVNNVESSKSVVNWLRRHSGCGRRDSSAVKGDGQPLYLSVVDGKSRSDQTKNPTGGERNVKLMK